MIVPEGKNKKYIKTVIGIYLLFVIIYPIITKVTGKSINFKNLDISKYSNSYQTSLDTKKYINDTYENNLKQEIKVYLENDRYTVKNISLKLSNDYEEIYEINLEIEKQTNEVNNVKEVKIDTNTTKRNNNDSLTYEEKEEIKENLSRKLNVDKSKIHIY